MEDGVQFAIQEGVSPLTHLLASWLISAKATDNSRDLRLATLAGVLPDLDGAGLAVDLVQGLVRGDEPKFYYYHQYHHYLLHGWVGGLAIALLLSLLARSRWRVLLLGLALFHLHLLCDFLGSRGPEPEDLWPIFYLAPLSKSWMWQWANQWRLDGWINQTITWLLFLVSLRIAIVRGESFVGVFSRWADAIFVKFLREAQARWRRRRRLT